MIGTDLPNQNGEFNYISPLRFWVQKVLPLTFDNSLSYYELLSKVVYKLNEVIEIVNPLGAGIEETINKYLEQFKTEWEAELQQFQTDVNAQINANNVSLNKRIDDLTTSVNTQIATNKTDTDQQIKDLTAQIMQQIATLAATISTTDEANRVWTLAQIQILKDTITDNLPPVIDPSDGLQESIQTTLNHMWDAFRPNALTAQKYDSLELTATEYDSKELTAENYDKYGEILLVTSNSYVFVGNVPVSKSAIDMEVIKNGIN